jgi:hypothetical protein
LARQAGGCEDHPTVTVFMYIYRLLSVYGIFRIPKRKMNVETVVDEAALPVFFDAAARPSGPTKMATCKQSVTECLESYSAEEIDPEEILDLDAYGQTLNDKVRQNVVFYLGGYVVKKAATFTDCETCLHCLEFNGQDLRRLHYLTDDHALLFQAKLRGALKLPSEHLFAFLLRLETVVSNVLSESGGLLVAFPEIMQEAIPLATVLRQSLCEEHGSSLVADIAIFYTVARLHWHAKAYNRSIASNKLVKNARKKSKLL